MSFRKLAKKKHSTKHSGTMKCDTKSTFKKKLNNIYSNLKRLDKDILKLFFVDIPSINTKTNDFNIMEAAFKKNNKLYTSFRKEVNKIFPDEVLGMEEPEFIHQVSKILYGIILYITQDGQTGGAMVEREEKDGEDPLYEGDDGLLRLPGPHRRRNTLKKVISFLARNKQLIVGLALLVASIFVLYASWSEAHDLLNFNLMEVPLQILATLADSNPEVLESLDAESTAAVNQMAVVRKGHTEVFKPFTVGDIIPTPKMGVSIMSVMTLGAKALVGRDELADAVIVIGKKYSVIGAAISKNLFSSGIKKAELVASSVGKTVYEEALKKRSLADKIGNVYNPGRLPLRVAVKAAKQGVRDTQDIAEALFIDVFKTTRQISRAIDDDTTEVVHRIENVISTARISGVLMFSALGAIGAWAGCGRKKSRRRRRGSPPRVFIEEIEDFSEEKGPRRGEEGPQRRHYHIEDRGEGKRKKNKTKRAHRKHRKHRKNTKKAHKKR